MKTRERVIQEAAANLAHQIFTHAKDVAITEEIKLQQHEYAEFNKSLETEIINQIVDNEILAKSKALNEEEIESYVQKLQQLQLEGANWTEFPDHLRLKLEKKLNEPSLSESTRNAIDATLASIAMIHPRNNRGEERLPTCPISLTPLKFKDKESEKNIVALSDGHLYDAKSIAQWASTKNKTPISNTFFTRGDYQRIKAKVPEFNIPGVHNQNHAQPEEEGSPLCTLTNIAISTGIVGGISAIAAGSTSNLTIFLAIFCPPVGVFALAGLIACTAYVMRCARQQSAPLPQAANFPAFERIEREVEITSPLSMLVRRNSGPQVAARTEVKLQEIKLELKEQKQTENTQRQNSSRHSLFSHPQTPPAESHVSSVGWVERSVRNPTM